MTDRPADVAGGRPNFILILTDQHRTDHTGFGGNPILQTPHLDALAARATVFTEAFAANPICMPNRATILTGRMPSVHGTRFNGLSLDWRASTFVRELRRSGYRTGLIGKAHFQNMGMGKPLIDMISKDWPSRDARDIGLPEGWDLLENDQRYRDGDVPLPDDFYGFDHVELTVGHADMVSGHYAHWLREHGIDPDTSQGPLDPDSALDLWWQIWRTSIPEELYPTAYIRDRSVSYLHQAQRRPQPFFLQCSFPDPHHPFTPPGKYFDMYDPADMTLPASFDDDHAGSLPHLQRWRATRGAQPPAVPVMPFSPTEAIYRQAAAKEYGSITMIDEAVGGILDTLESTGLSSNTVVLFSSDHAEMFGDHGLMLKAAMHYRPALRVPFVIADPTRPASSGQTSDSLVGSIDIAQTILAMAGVPEFAGMQGHNLVPLLTEPNLEVRDSLLIEEDEPFDLAGVGGPLRMRTLLTREARCTLLAGSSRGELFDLTEDPAEMANRYGDSAQSALQSDMTTRLATSLLEHSDTGVVPTYLA